MVAAPLALLAVAWFLNRSRLGTAIRASAERSDRAAMLGIPVARLNTVVWMIAAALSFFALFLRSGITGSPLGFAEGLPTLLIALAALAFWSAQSLVVAFAADPLGPRAFPSTVALIMGGCGVMLLIPRGAGFAWRL